MIFVAYELNLPLNMEKPHYRSQHAGEWSLIWAHDSRPIYRALTYIAVQLLGPHQPRYIGLTLYHYSATLFHTRSNPGYSLTSGLHRLHSQYHVCWCSSDFRSQGISSHVNDPQSQNIPSFSSIKRVKITTSSSRGQWVNAMWLDGLWRVSISRCHPSSRGIPIINIKSTA